MEVSKTNTLSFYNDQGVLTLSAKQYDTGRKFIFNIINDYELYDLTGCSVYLRMKKADNTEFQGEECCTINENKIIVDTSVGNGDQILSCSGTNLCELHLTDSDGKSVTTWNFIINVEPRVHDGDGILSENSWDMMDSISDTIIDLKNEKMDKTNPTGTGSFSLNRKSGTTVGTNSFTEGFNNTASADYSHAEGSGTTASGKGSHAEGHNTTASGNYSNAEGYNTIAYGNYSHSEGQETTASDNYSHSEGAYTLAKGAFSHAEGENTTAIGKASHTKGINTVAAGQYSHAEGYSTLSAVDIVNKYPIIGSINDLTTISKAKWESILNVIDDHTTEGWLLASGTGSHAEGMNSFAIGTYSHAEGVFTKSLGKGSHVEGYDTVANANYSHAEGYKTAVSDFGDYSHAEGESTFTKGKASHAEGYHTIANANYQHVQGSYNVADTTSAFIIGNGTDDNNRSNALTLDWDGNLQVSGDVIDGEGHSLTVLSKDLPFPLAIQDGVYGYIKREEGADTFVPFNNKFNNKLYLTVQNKLANKLTVLSSFSCTESSEKYNITIIPSLTPTEQNTTA